MRVPEPPQEGDFFVGDWLVRPRLNQLVRGGREIGIEPRAMSLLVTLSRSPATVVTRRQLHERVWSDVAVSDETVNRTVFDLRRVLGDRASNPVYLETIRKVGYRLIAPVRPVPAPGEGVEPHLPEVSAPAPRRWPRAWPLGLALALPAALLLGLLADRLLDPRPATASLPRVRQLTAYPGYETHPAVSPGGGRLAFSWDGGEGGNIDVYWRRIEGGTPVRLSPDAARDDNPKWAPDGERLSYVRTGEKGCDLMLATVATGEVSRLAGCREAAISPPVWARDGQGLIFSDRDSPREPFRLHRLDLLSGQVSRLSSPLFGSLGDLYPSLSPSGRRLAFVRATAKSTISTYLTPAIGDLYLLDLEDPDGTARRLTFDNQLVAGVAWSESERELFYVSTREGLGYSLWRLPIEGGGEPRLLLSTTGLLRFPERAGRGRLAYERWEGKTDIWDVPLEGPHAAATRGEPLQVSTRSDLNPQWSPDGRRLAFTSARSGNYEIWVSRADGRQPEQVTFFEDHPAESPRWSPDGESLVFEVREPRGSHLYRVDRSGGRATRLTGESFDDRAPSFSADGRWIYFGSNRSGSWQIWRIGSGGGGATQMTRAGGFRALESAHTDPHRLYYSKRDRGGIWTLDGEGRERRVAELAPEHWGNWEIVGSRLFFVELEASTTRVRRVDLGEETSEVAGRIEGWISREAPNLAVSSDGSRVLLARFTGLAADLLAVDFGPDHR